MEAFLGVVVKPAPDQFVGNDDKNAHYRNAADDHRCIPLLGNLGYVGAEAVRLQGSVTPGGKLGDNTGVPRSTRCSASTSHPEGKYSRQDQSAPICPAT